MLLVSSMEVYIISAIEDVDVLFFIQKQENITSDTENAQFSIQWI